MWKYYAILSAFFAALTALFAKLGTRGVSGTLATAVRTMVVLVLAWGIFFFTERLSQVRTLDRTNWIFLILSGIATGLSWIFYFKALETGDISRVAPIDKLSVALTMGLGFVVLGEPLDWKTVSGGLLIVAGTLLIVL